MSATRVLRLARRSVGATALVLTFPVGTALAQAGASTGLMGRVTDSSGAAVPGVTVTLANVETGSVRAVTSSAIGDWEARFLAPGNYRVTFELTGFKTLRRDGVTVSTAEMATVNVSLEIGALAEAVQVVANAEMVSSGSMTMARTLDQKELEALPTSARNFTQLLVIEPGVSAAVHQPEPGARHRRARRLPTACRRPGRRIRRQLLRHRQRPVRQHEDTAARMRSLR